MRDNCWSLELEHGEQASSGYCVGSLLQRGKSRQNICSMSRFVHDCTA